MTTRFAAVAALALALLLTASCDGGGGDDDDDGATSPTPIPTGSASKTFALAGSGFQVAHIGETALVRVLVTDSKSSVVFCDESAPISNSGVFSVSSVPALVLTTNVGYTVELFANVSGGAPSFDDFTTANPDHIYVIDVPAVQDDVAIDFAHGVQASPNDFTWANGSGCPGL